MRHHPSCWSKVLAKLGYRRVARRHSKLAASRSRLSRIESLEARQLLSITVNTLVDVTDPNDGRISLREAIADAPANGNVVDFHPSLFGGVIALNSNLNITQSVTIEGPGADLLTLDAAHNSRVVFVSSGVAATISGLTLAKGNAGADNGGAVYNNGTLTLRDVTIEDSRAGGSGGGVFNNSSATLSIHNSTLQNNRAASGAGLLTSATNATVISGSLFAGNVADDGVGGGWGGGIVLGGATGGAVSIHNSTFSGNRAKSSSGAVQVSAVGATLTMVNSTLTNNVADTGDGGGLRVYSGTATLHNSIVAGNTASVASGRDVAGAVSNSSANNLFSQSSVTNLSGSLSNQLSANPAQVFVDDSSLPGYQPLLADNGGPTKTHALRIDSPALDQGSNLQAINAAINFDQRGYNRFVDNANHSVVERGVIDIGAYEYGLVVTAQADGTVGASPRNDLSLREALALAAKLTGPNQIEFAANVEGVLSLSTAGSFIIDSDVEIVGPGLGKLTLDAQGLSRVFYVAAGKTAAISGLTLVRGEAGSGHGGAIYNNGGILKLREMALSNNHAGGVGGALFNNEGSSLEIVDSTFIGNQAPYGGAILTSSTSLTSIHSSAFISNKAVNGVNGSGGAIVLGGAVGGAVSIYNSTFSGNLADTNAAAIQLAAPNAALTVVNATITDNKAQLPSSEAGGIRVFSGVATLHNTIVAGNFAGNVAMSDFAGAIASASSNNLFTQASVTGLAANQGNQTGVIAATLFVDDPALPGYQPQLADNGGSTKTHALRFASANLALDSGSNTKAKDANLKVDQRGYSRFANASGLSTAVIDIGAFEFVANQGTAIQETIGDFNGDGRDDRLRFDPTTRSLLVMVGAATTAQNELQSWGAVPTGIAAASSFTVGDFNGDGRDDVLIRAASTFYLAISDGATFVVRSAALPGNWGPIYVGDFDADGSDDLLGGTSSGPNYSWSIAKYADASGLAAPVAVPSLSGFAPSYQQFFQDVNRDGRAEIITRTGASASWMVRAANVSGTPSFQAPVDWSSWIAYGYDNATGKLNADKAMAKVIEEFAWVYNNVELELYPGLMKGPTATDQTKAGNDWDQAALLEKRLQELPFLASTDVKIASGNVRVSVTELQKWLGVTTPSAAYRVVATALDSNVKGYNSLNQQLSEPGIIGDVAFNVAATIIEFKHAWVRATVPMAGGMQTIDLDPSWKFKERQNGTPLPTTGNLASGNHASAGLFDEFDFLALDPRTDHRLPLEFFEDQAMAWLMANQPGKSLADVPRSESFVTRHFAQVPSGLGAGVLIVDRNVSGAYDSGDIDQYSSLTSITDASATSRALTHRVIVTMKSGSTIRWSQELSVPIRSLDSIVISFTSTAASASSADANLAYSSTNGPFFSRLILDGEVRAWAPEPFYSPQKATIEVLHLAPEGLTVAVAPGTPDAPGPSRNDRLSKYSEFPGQVIAIGLDANQYSRDFIANKQGELLTNSATFHSENDLRKHVDDLTALAAAKYWYTFNRNNKTIEGLTQTVSGQQWVGSGIVKSDSVLLIDPNGNSNEAGLIRYLPYGMAPVDFGVDLPNINHATLDIASGVLNKEAWQLVGYNSSALEHTVVEEVIGSPSISTMKGLQQAFQRTLGLNANNAQINYDVVQEYTSKVVNNVRVITHVGNWYSNGTTAVTAASPTNLNIPLSNLHDYLLSTSSPQGQMLSHVGSTDLGEDIEAILAAPVASGDIRILVPFGQTKLNSWIGGVYLVETASSMQFKIVADTTTNGGFGSGITLPPPKQLQSGNFLNASSAGDPVNVANGNMFRDETDIIYSNSGIPLTFSRHYDSQSLEDFGLGVGWTYSFGDVMYAEIVDGIENRVWLDSMGRRHYFKPNGSGGYLVPSSLQGEVSYTNQNAGVVDFIFKGSDGIEYHFEKVNFNQSTKSLVGRLSRILDSNGDGIAVKYESVTSRKLLYVYDVHDTNPLPLRRLGFIYRPDASQIESITKCDVNGSLGTWDYRYVNVVGLENQGSSRRLSYVDSPAAPAVDNSGVEATLRSRVEYIYRNTAWDHATGLIEKIIEHDGSWHTYEYFKNGRVFRVKQGEYGVATDDPRVDVQTFDYNIYRSQTEFTDERGNIETYVHQANGLLVKQIHADRSQTTSKWGVADALIPNTLVAGTELLMTSTIDERGAVETFTYYTTSDFKKGQLKSSTEKSYTPSTALVTSYDYVQPDPTKPHLVAISSTVVDPDASPYVGKKITTSNQYYSFGDSYGKLWKTTDVEGNIFEYSYYTTADGGSAYRIGLLKSIKQPAILDPNGTNGATIAYETVVDYDAAGNIVSSTTQNAATLQVISKSTFVYDSSGNVTQTIVGANVVAERVVTESAYDVLGRLRETGFADANATIDPYDAYASRYKYDKSGRIRESVDALGRVTRFEYDRQGNVGKQINPDGTELLHEYDAFGNRVATTDALKRTMRFVYDNRNRLIQTILPGGAVERLRYDGAGNVVAQIDALGNATTFKYDASGRLLETKLPDPDGPNNDDGGDNLTEPTTTNKYDKLGNLIESIDPEANVTQFQYDKLGRVVQTQTLNDPTGVNRNNANLTAVSTLVSLITTDYDAVGNVIETAAYDVSQYATATLLADPRAQQTTQNIAANKVQVVSVRFDAFGQPVKTINADGTSTRTEYDAVGRVRYQYDEAGSVTEFLYDALGRLERTKLPDPTTGAITDFSPTTIYQYDAVGNRIAVTNARGYTTRFEYDVFNRVSATIDALGNRSQSLYDVAGQLVATIDAMGSATYSRYDARGRVVETRLADPDGAGPGVAPASRSEYDAAGRLTESIDALGYSTTYQYDRLGRLLSETSVASAAPVILATRSYQYDANGNLTKATDPLNRISEYLYDELNRRTKTTEPSPGVNGPTGAALPRPQTTTAYDGYGNVQSVLEHRGGGANQRTTRYEYDLRNRRSVEIVDAGTDGANGVSNYFNQRTEFSYDPVGNLTQKREYAENASTSGTFDLLRTTAYLYDRLGRRTRETRNSDGNDSVLAAAEQVTITLYDAVGNVTAVAEDVLPSGAQLVTLFQYDGLNQLVEETAIGSSSSRQTRYRYDAVGNQIAVVDPLGRVSRSEYDRLGRLVKSIAPDPDGADPLASETTSFSYDASGNLLKEVNGAGEQKSYAYDPQGRLIESIDGRGDKTTRRYDKVGNLVELIDPAQNVTTYVYDGLGRLSSETTAAGTRSFVYNAAGCLAQTTDRDGRVAVRISDRLDRVVRELWYADLVAADGSSYSAEYRTNYDPLGRVVETRAWHRRWNGTAWVLDYRVTDSYQRDGLDRVVERSNQSLENPATLSSTGVPAIKTTYAYGYDSLGLVITRDQFVAGQFAAQTRSTYNAFGELVRQVDSDYPLAGGGASAILDFESTDAAFAYFNDGSLASTTRYTDWDGTPLASGHRNRVQTDYAYDGAGRLKDIVHSQTRRIAAANAWPAATELVDFAFGYDDASRINFQSTDWNTAVAAFSTRSDETQAFDFDDSGQLNTVDSNLANRDASYNYSANGNRTFANESAGGNDFYQTVANNRVSEDSTYSYQYDGEGNLTRRTSLADATDYETYAWDHRNRLTKVERYVNAALAETVSYRYNASDDLVYRNSTLTGLEHYLVESGQRTMAFETDGDVKRRYHYGPTGDVLFDQVFDHTVTTPLQGETDLLLPIGDHQQSTRVVLAHNVSDDAIYVRQSLDYASFGSTLTILGANGLADAGGAVTIFGHHGSLADAATGLQLKGERWYSPDLGRFISEDPIQDGANWYMFAGNDPVNYADPSGLSMQGHPLAGGYSDNKVTAPTIKSSFLPGFNLVDTGIAINGLAKSIAPHVNSLINASTRTLASTLAMAPPIQIQTPVKSTSIFERMGNAVARTSQNTWNRITGAARAAELEVNYTTGGLRQWAIDETDGLGESAGGKLLGDPIRTAANGIAAGIDTATYNSNIPVRLDEDYRAYRKQGVGGLDAAALAASQRIPIAKQFLTAEELATGRSNGPGELNKQLDPDESLQRLQHATMGIMATAIGFFAYRGNGGRGGNADHARVQQGITDHAGGRQEVRIYENGPGSKYRIVDNLDSQGRYHQVGDMRYRGGRFSPSSQQRGAIEDIRKAAGPDAVIIFHDKLGKGPTLINPDLKPDWRPAPAKQRKFDK